MDPSPFIGIIVESLALKLPPLSRSAGAGVHPSTTPCFCVIQLQDSTLSAPQTVPLPLASSRSQSISSSSTLSPVIFSLNPSAVHGLSGKQAGLIISVYAGRRGTTCGIRAASLLGRVRVAVQPAVIKSGWITLSGGGGCCGGGPLPARLHLIVRSEPAPRLVFQFGGEPECSPVVYQIGGGNCLTRSGCLRQPAFSCRFSADRRRITGSSSIPPDSSSSRRSKLKSLLPPFISQGSRRRRREQRKGWSVTIHDLSGSPVAAASMITPFVPSPGSDRVTRANPGAWLILRPSNPSSTTWKPCGRLEAWREVGPALGYRFDLAIDSGPTAFVPIAESSISFRKGGEFRIGGGETAKGSGFVMGSTVGREGRASRPEVQLGAKHVTCMGDAAVFLALAAAVDLSMDACQLFSRKLRKELSCDQQDSGFY